MSESNMKSNRFLSDLKINGGALLLSSESLIDDTEFSLIIDNIEESEKSDEVLAVFEKHISTPVQSRSSTEKEQTNRLEDKNLVKREKAKVGDSDAVTTQIIYDFSDDECPENDEKEQKVETKLSINDYDYIKERYGWGLSELIDESSDESNDDNDEDRSEISLTKTFPVQRNLVVKPNKSSLSYQRRIKMSENFVRPFLIKDFFADCTPKRLILPGDAKWASDPIMFKFPSEKLQDFSDVFGCRKSNPVIKVAKRLISNEYLRKDSRSFIDLFSSSSRSLSAPSLYPLNHMKTDRLIDKRKLVFRITESETVDLFESKSYASPVNSEEGREIKIENRKVIRGSFKEKTLLDSYTQTSWSVVLIKNKATQHRPDKRKNSYAFVSYADYYDELKARKEVDVSCVNRKQGKVDNTIYPHVRSKEEPLIGPNFTITDRLSWFKASLTIERLLLSNNATRKKLMFYSVVEQDPLARDEVTFRYKLCRFCTLKTKTTKGKSVTSLSWNVHEPNILAVGYGKFHFQDCNSGLIHIWNDKNFVSPEREYTFEHPVTCLNFSTIFPQILAISFYSGLVMLIDIIKDHGIRVIATNVPAHQKSIYPVWKLLWVKNVIKKETENLIECKGDGCVFKYTHIHLYEKQLIMQLSKMKRIVRGIPRPKSCQPYVIPLTRHPTVLCMTLHPTNPYLYYLGSDEGGVYKCSQQDVCQHLSMFSAHIGPVYSIEFHPSCSKIFLTSGADWFIRIWCDGIFQPLLTISSSMSCVQSARWCPNLPTIILALTRTQTVIWDIGRNTTSPQSIVENISGCLNTVIDFAPCGNNIHIGDNDGNVYVYTLREMPFQPTYPEMTLALTLIKALVPKPKLLSELKKMGYPFTVPKHYQDIAIDL